MTRAEIEELFARRHEAIRRRDAIGVAAFHAADGWYESPLAGSVRGRLAIAKVYEAWATGFPDLTPFEEELVIDGDRVVSIMALEGTDNGGFMGLPATGKHFRITMVFICEIANGEFVNSRSIYDFTGLLVQIGLLKTRPI